MSGINRKDVISVSQAHDTQWRSTEADPNQEREEGKRG